MVYCSSRLHGRTETISSKPDSAKVNIESGSEERLTTSRQHKHRTVRFVSPGTSNATFHLPLRIMVKQNLVEISIPLVIWFYIQSDKLMCFARCNFCKLFHDCYLIAYKDFTIALQVSCLLP